jgi:Metallo-beta-lactamase superfamily
MGRADSLRDMRSRCDCYLSVPADGQRERIGGKRSGRGPRRFDSGSFPKREHTAHRWRRRISGIQGDRRAPWTRPGRGSRFEFPVVPRLPKTRCRGIDARTSGPHRWTHRGAPEFSRRKAVAGTGNTAPAFLRLKQVANHLHVPIEQEQRGQSFTWGGVQVDFLWPEQSGDIAPMAKNNDSLVVRLKYGDRTILLPGDAENAPESLRADVLKVGHHGSKNSTVPDFLAAVNPRISIISAGEENPYGHPNPELLQRLEETGTRILRTDRDGAVQILTDGQACKSAVIRRVRRLRRPSQCARKRQITPRTTRSSRKPNAASYS